jgi:YfiH family protein
MIEGIVPAWDAPASVHAFFTTRNGGVSAGANASLDLGSSVAGDAASAEAIAENRRRVEALLPSPPVWLDQVHGTDVVVVNDVRPARAPRADAAVTRARDVVLAVRVADCLPVLFSDRAGSVVAIAHAGWRGLAGGVLERTVSAIACDAGAIVAWLGPAIGRSAFEVGDEVRAAFVATDPGAGAAFARGDTGKWHADLEALARRRLAHAGVAAVAGGGMCTASDPARFFSFRRDRTTGRMAAFIWRAGE